MNVFSLGGQDIHAQVSSGENKNIGDALHLILEESLTTLWHLQVSVYVFVFVCCVCAGVSARLFLTYCKMGNFYVSIFHATA